MSMLIPGLALPPPPPPAEPVVAAAVILWRPGPRGREVYWVRRGALRFAGGFMAFPGGRLDPADAQMSLPGLPAGEAALAACAARELFEETGVLLARGPGLSSEAREAGRRRLLAEASAAAARGEAAPSGPRPGAFGFGAFLASHGLSVDAAALSPAGRWVTPAWAPLRYDAQLYLARLPPGEAAEVWPGELDSGEWIAAAEAVARWERGEVLLHPPNLWGLQCLALAEPPACLARLRAPPATTGHVTRRVEFQRDLFLAPLRTPTLPPATHTNAFLVPLQGGGLAVVDPGSGDTGELAFLEEVLRDLAPEHGPLRELWLTHAHPDHTGGVGLLRARHRLLLRAHAEVLRALGAGEGPDAVAVTDGELLGGRFRTVHTPGHARGHLAFLEERTGALLAGDMLSTLSTIVIDPPEGDMGTYLASLRRLAALAPRTLFPAHGMPAQGAVKLLDAALAHRQERTAKVLAALPGSLEEVTARAYDDTPAAVHPVAARSCLATLLHLEGQGLARRAGTRWMARPRGG